MNIAASKPGTSAPKIEKRTGDSIVCLIDCQPILSDKEIVCGTPLNSPSDLEISEVRTVNGKFIQFRISGGPSKVPYTNYPIVFTVNTNLKNTLIVPITVRVYSN